MRHFLFESDTRDLIRLLGEAAVFDTDQTGKKRFLMDGLCDLVEASAWVWAIPCDPGGNPPPGHEALMYGGPDEARFTRLLEMFECPEMTRVAQFFFEDLARRNTQVRKDPQHAGADPAFSETEASIVWREAGFGAVIVSSSTTASQWGPSKSAIALYRRSGMPEFSERDRRIAHLVLSEVPWLHLNGPNHDLDSSAPRLYARQRIILKLLLEGQDRKSIADQLEISVNTVSGYCKEIYRHFGVNSQAALMAHIFLGRREDTSLEVLQPIPTGLLNRAT